jgi:chromosome partitioning protein
MKSILIANSKGGVGKTTLATNLAGYLAGQGAHREEPVVLADWDVQGSASAWHALRPVSFPKIHLWNQSIDREAIKGLDAKWMVVDTAAGLAGQTLLDLAQRAHKVLIPLQPSAFDMRATADFLAQMTSINQAHHVALVGMRVAGHYKSAEALDAFLATIDLPVLTHLRNGQVYVQCAEMGLSIFDLPRSRAEHDWTQWQPILDWVKA